jgi:mannitol/fructose-specific phosphotransferase system IIA component
VIAPAWRGFGETVDGLLDRLVEVGLLSAGARVDAAAAVRAREREASTAVLDTGVGIPHARIAGISHPVVGLAVSPGGFYEAAPTVAIRIVALVLSPSAALDEHLRALADIATLLPFRGASHAAPARQGRPGRARRAHVRDARRALTRAAAAGRPGATSRPPRPAGSR